MKIQSSDNLKKIDLKSAQASENPGKINKKEITKLCTTQHSGNSYNLKTQSSKISRRHNH